MDIYERAVIDNDRSGNIDLPDLRELWRCDCGRIAIDLSAVGTEVQWYAPIDPPAFSEPTCAHRTP